MKNRRGLRQGFVIGLVLLAVAITSYGVQQGLAQDAKAQATIEKALAQANQNKTAAAKLLGITRATLRKRVQKFGIQKELNIK